MKVLFAVSNEKDAETITRVYQEEYKEIISSKTVYYFNAIIKELQKDKTYDRIVISEDVEMMSNNNYQAVDKFIFEKMDTISDEATNVEGDDIPIILLCGDRRTKNDPLLLKLFSLGIYNVLIGQDRSVQKVCNLMYRPRTKKEAKIYYKVDSVDEISYTVDGKSSGVNESELQNILNYYKKIGNNVSKCTHSFASLVSQYSSEQLKLIAEVLPNDTKAILEENSDEYRKLMKIKTPKLKGTSKLREKDYVEKEITVGNRLTKPVIIPTAVNTKKVVKVQKNENSNKEEIETKIKEKEKLAKEKIEAEKKEKLRLAKEKTAAEKREKERIAKEKAEAEKKEKERIAKEKAAAEKKEKERLAKEKAEAEKKEKERLAKEKAEAEKKEKERLAKEKAEAEKKEKERLAKEKAATEKKEKERLAKENEEPKRGRGRPRKDILVVPVEENNVVKKRRGRPRKNEDDVQEVEDIVDEQVDGVISNLEDTEYIDTNQFTHEDLMDFNDYEDEEEIIEEDEDLIDFEDYEDEKDTLEEDEDLIDFEDYEDEEDTLEEDEDLINLEDYEDEKDTIEEDEDLINLEDYEDEEDTLEEDEDLINFEDYEDEEEAIEEDEDLINLEDYEDEEDTLEEDEDLINLEDYEDEENTLEEDKDLINLEDYEDEEEAIEEDEDLIDFEDYEDEKDTIEEDEDLINLEDYEDEEETIEEDEDLINLGDYEDEENITEKITEQEQIDKTIESNQINDEVNNWQPKTSFKGIANRNYKYDNSIAESIKDLNENELEKENINIDVDNFEIGNQKIAAFIGTSKNGTSFIVNNLAENLSNRGIKTAILDLTKNKNSYYIYTNDNDELRGKAQDCFEKLRTGVADGIKVNNYLSVYTSLPEEDDGVEDVKNIIKTLLENYTTILIDCDFSTDIRYFKIVQEIYLVQTLDILTIQPLTTFLRDLKMKGILEPNKLRIVINKNLKVKSITDEILIGGMSVYKDPGMTYMTDLFDKNNIKYTTIPFEQQVYVRYLEGLVNCKISSKGYSKNFLYSLNRLSEMVYPTINSKVNKKNRK